MRLTLKPVATWQRLLLQSLARRTPPYSRSDRWRIDLSLSTENALRSTAIANLHAGEVEQAPSAALGLRGCGWVTKRRGGSNRDTALAHESAARWISPKAPLKV
jgi:hypothetical protein